MKHAFALILIAGAAPAFAEETRHLGAHEHGVGEFNIAFEGSDIAIELHAPGNDIVGFEHPAESDADQAAIAAGVETLENPLSLFVFPAAANCSVTMAHAELEAEEHDDHEGHDDHADHDDHDDHAEDADHDDHEDHDDHADHEDHAEHDDHDDHDDHDEEGGHTEFHAEYALTCATPSAIDRIDFAYFDAFPNARELEVQLISDKGTAGFEVERDAPSLDLSGKI